MTAHDATPPPGYGDNVKVLGNRPDGSKVYEPVAPNDPRWAHVRRDFPANAQGKLPKPGQNASAAASCSICGGFHKGAGGVHVDYLGHAFVRERLNEVPWDLTIWRTASGDPMIIEEGELATLPFTMTVMGVDRHEVACAPTGKEEWPKLLWSDMISRGGMAHGIGLSLWQKDMPAGGADDRSQPRGSRRAPTLPPPDAEADKAALRALVADLRATVTTLAPDELEAWTAWKASTGFDPSHCTLTAAGDAAEWLGSFLAEMRGPGNDPAEG